MNKHLLPCKWLSIRHFLFSGILIFALNNIVHAQITSTTPNSYFTIASFQDFEMPTATDVVAMGVLPELQVIVSTTPSPTLHWDDHNGHKSSLVITSFGSNTVFLDDVVLTKPPGGTSPVAVITCRELLPNNTVNIRLLLAVWASNSFSLLPGLLLDNRANNSDWFDRVSISTTENGATFPTRQELFVTWQEAGRIWVSEGFINFNTDVITFYNTKVDVFPTLAASTFRHPDISRKTGNYKTIIAVQNTGGTQNLLSFDYQNTELSPVFVPSNSPSYATWYTTSVSTMEVKTPRIEKSLMQYSVATGVLVDQLSQRSVVCVFGDIGGMNAASMNKGFEFACTGNTNYKKTGYPAIAVTQNLPGNIFNYEIVWQQVVCNGTDFCNIEALSKRYQYDALALNLVPLFSSQYFYLNADLTKNSFFPCIASLPSSCSNYYSFDIMDKTTSLNGQVAYKTSTCNGAAVRTSFRTGATSQEPAKIVAGQTGKLATGRQSVYPNPVNDLLYLDMRTERGIFYAEIYNASGGLAKKISFKAEAVVAVNTSDLPSGLYYLKISSLNKQVFKQKVTVIH